MDKDKAKEIKRKRAKLIKKPRYGTVPEAVYLPGEEGLLEIDYVKEAEKQAEEEKRQEEEEHKQIQHRHDLDMMDDI